MFRPDINIFSRQLTRCLVTASLVMLPITGIADNSSESENILHRIKQQNTLVVAYRETAVPFSYLIKQGKPVGYGMDISHRVIKAIKKKLGLPKLQVKWQPVTISTRMMMLTKHIAQIECGQTTNTLKRQDSIAFSNTFYVAEEGIAVRTGSTISDYADLAGKRVAVAANTTTEESVRALSQTGGFTVSPQRTNTAALIALTKGDVDAYIAAKPILAGVIAAHADSEEVKIVGGGSKFEAFACMLPKDQPEFKQIVDEVLSEMMRSGEMEKLYNKWFMKPIPPHKYRVGLEMNAQTREAFANPNDNPL